MARQRILLTVLALAIPGCSNPANVVTEEAVTVGVEQRSVLIRNDRSAKIVFMVLDGAFAARVNWVACADPACEGVPPGDSRRIPLNQIGGHGESNYLIVHWWHVVHGSDGTLQPDSIRGLGLKY